MEGKSRHQGLDKSDELVIGRKNVLNRWKEYFEELLNVDIAQHTNGDMNVSMIEAQMDKICYES